MSLYRYASQAQKNYLRALGASSLNPFLSEAEAKLIAGHLIWTARGRFLGEPVKFGRIRKGEV